jgi:hypothetical protein
LPEKCASVILATDFDFRKRAVSELTPSIGVYVLADLDNVPIYVGKSTDGIRARVRRHLTSARSDIIANRQIDVWEIAYVWAYPLNDKAKLSRLEAALFHRFNEQSSLMNGQIPSGEDEKIEIPEPSQIIQVMSDEEIKERQAPAQRLPRQATHYARIVDHFLAVKNSSQIARAMQAHFERLSRYHKMMLDLGEDKE